MNVVERTPGVVRLAKLRIHVVSTVRTAPTPSNLLQNDQSWRKELPIMAKPRTAYWRLSAERSGVVVGVGARPYTQNTNLGRV